MKLSHLGEFNAIFNPTNHGDMGDGMGGDIIDH